MSTNLTYIQCFHENENPISLFFFSLFFLFFFSSSLVVILLVSSIFLVLKFLNQIHLNNYVLIFVMKNYNNILIKIHLC